MKIAFLLSAPPLFAALIVGLLISIFQAVTQIQEMTLAIIPKMIAVLLAMAFAFPWLLEVISTYTETVLRNIPLVLR